MTKPLLFLDVDGVLNILPGVLETRTAPPKGFETHTVHTALHVARPVLVSKEIGRALAALSDDVEIVWLTHWNNHANVIGRLIGMPGRLNFLAVPSYLPATRKCITLHAHLSWAHRTYRVFWVDDQITPEDFEQLSNRLPRAEISALKTDPAVGLRLQDIELLRSEIDAFLSGG